ncbi:50S ribosomal protein L29 [Candidatus Falkowbacteria bacterium]|nr:50S ribosomal protein L29 [Candidatus Falkowbacteria bacterium]
MKVKEQYKELKLKSEAELNKILISSREKLRDLRFKVSQNQLKNIREVRAIKKKIAQILTLIGQKRKLTKEKKVQ